MRPSSRQVDELRAAARARRGKYAETLFQKFGDTHVLVTVASKAPAAMAQGPYVA